MVYRKQTIIWPRGHGVAQKDQGFEVTAVAEAEDLGEVFYSVVHEEEVLQSRKVVAQTVDVLDVIVVGC
jgi:hypothetical protein